MQDWNGKVALVTGASRGIGKAVALALAGAGMDIGVNYHERKEAALETCKAIEACGRRCVAVPANVALNSEVTRLVEMVHRELGPIQVLVNNAGIARRQPFDEITEEDWDELLNVNLKSAFLVTRAVLPAMRQRRWGRIINVSSVAAHIGGVVGPHYAASKAGMLGLTHAYANLLVKEGITVNAIAPALIVTEMVTENLQVGPDMIPVGRFGTAEEVAAVALMLVRNAYMTGQTINVDGGVYMS